MKTRQNFNGVDQYRYEAIRIIFTKHSNLLNFLFDPIKPELRVSPECLLNQSKGYSSGEKILIKTALDVWNESGDTRISELLNTLDDDNFSNVLLALSKLRTLDLEFLNIDISF